MRTAGFIGWARDERKENVESREVDRNLLGRGASEEE
jgi:hypothetical protein